MGGAPPHDADDVLDRLVALLLTAAVVFAAAAIWSTGGRTAPARKTWAADSHRSCTAPGALQRIRRLGPAAETEAAWMSGSAARQTLVG